LIFAITLFSGLLGLQPARADAPSPEPGPPGPPDVINALSISGSDFFEEGREWFDQEVELWIERQPPPELRLDESVEFQPEDFEELRVPEEP
jgi:hypothetical protein